MKLDLNPTEARILGVLIEKEFTTPDVYPLTLKGLLAGCNQKSNRHPVMDLTEEDLARPLAALQYDRQLIGTWSGVGSRVIKYTHRLTEMLGIDAPEAAVLCELLLRGPQTPGELRTRASRMISFSSLDAVRDVLDDLAARRPDPYVVELPRAPGRKECRYAHTFGNEPPELEEDSSDTTRPQPAVSPAVESAARMEQRIRALEERMARLESELGIREGAD